MNAAQKNRLRVLVQSLTEAAVSLGRISHEDDQDRRPENERGSTHETRLSLAKNVHKIRFNIERFLANCDDKRIPLLGTKIKLARPIERFPEFIAPEGLVGTVIENGIRGSGHIAVQMDESWEGCNEERTIMWIAGDEPLNAIFWEDVDVPYIPSLTN